MENHIAGFICKNQRLIENLKTEFIKPELPSKPLPNLTDYWDDLVGTITSAIITGNNIYFDPSNCCLNFSETTSINEHAWLTFQIPHKWLIGSVISPHVHWEQSQKEIPNFLFKYRWQRAGLDKSDWQNYCCNKSLFDYVLPVFNQIAIGDGIVPPVGHGISDILQLRLIRDVIIKVVYLIR